MLAFRPARLTTPSLALGGGVVVLVVSGWGGAVVRGGGVGSPRDPAERRTTACGAGQVYRAIENAWRSERPGIL